MSFPRLTSINIKGYRPFRDFTAEVGALEVLVGANGSGKSSLFEFLKFLRDGMQGEIPPSITEGGAGQQLFHKPGPDQFSWDMLCELPPVNSISYSGELLGPIGNIKVTAEKVDLRERHGSSAAEIILNMTEAQERATTEELKQYLDQISLKRYNRLNLGTMTSPKSGFLFALREYIKGWMFYSSLAIAKEKIQRSTPVEQEPELRESCGNISSVLHYLMTEHQEIFEELQSYLRMVVPGFQELTVKARGGPGEVIAFWREKGVDVDLSLADLSDGILRLLCWMVLCLHPKPPALICVDEPDQGVHPRTLSVLAGLFQKASERTQIFLATHSSYFLTQFDLTDVAVMKKENGEVFFSKPKDSKVINSLLEDFGTDEIGYLHWSDQLETFS